MIELSGHGILASATNVVAWLVIGVALIQNGAYLVQLVVAHRALVREPPQPVVRTLWRRSLSSAPPIALLAPAYNEAGPSPTPRFSGRFGLTEESERR